MGNNKKKRWTNKKPPKDIKDIIGIIYFSICVAVFAYAAIGVPILLYMLKKYGTKTEAEQQFKYYTWIGFHGSIDLYIIGMIKTNGMIMGKVTDTTKNLSSVRLRKRKKMK